jgi:hypothetical protein
MGLGAERLQAAASPESLRAAWNRFVSPDDIVVGYNGRVLALLGAAVALPERQVELKSAYRSRAKGARGPLSAVVRELGLEPRGQTPLCGRAAEHLADLAALFEHLLGAGP